MNIDLTATSIAILTYFGIYALMAMSLNLEYGIAGIPNFGKALFVSIGAYTAGMTYTRLLPILAGHEVLDPCGATLGQALQLRSEIMQMQPVVGFMNFGITLFIACLIGGIIGYLISYATLRLKEEWFLALVLLVGGEILRIIVRGYKPVICASNGISAVAQPFGFIEDTRMASIAFMVFVLLLVLVVYLYLERLLHSPFGRLLKAVRENEIVARSLGKDVARIRAQVMFIGSVIAAISGVLFVVNIGFVSTNDYIVGLTLDVWVMIVLGGMGNNRGALLGAFLITLLDRFTAIIAVQMSMSDISIEFNYVRFILFGIILLLMLHFRPQGILPETAKTTDAHDMMAGNNHA